MFHTKKEHYLATTYTNHYIHLQFNNPYMYKFLLDLWVQNILHRGIFTT